MTSCPPTPHPKSPRFRSAVEVAVELAHLALVAHRDLSGLRAIRVLPDLRVMPVSADLLDRKALGVFRVLLDPLVAELEEPRFLDQKALGVQLALPDQRAIKASKALPDPLAQPEQMGNQGLRVTMV